jgi:hypothetical protein
MTIFLNTYGKHIGTRSDAIRLRDVVLSELQKHERVKMDFSGVRSLSNIFALELFNNLTKHFDKETLKSLLIIQNASENIKFVIDQAYKNKLKTFEMA